MGEIITLDFGSKYQYELPKAPGREQDYLYYDLPRSEQYWHRPQLKNVSRMSEREKISYIERERDRWLNGVWMLIDGEPTWISGMHYDHLTYMTFDFGKAQYFDQQRLDFYARDMVWKDPCCFGSCWLKPRRYGMSAEEITENTYVLIGDENAHVGVVSNEKKKTTNTLARPIIDSYVKRPRWMREEFYAPAGKKPRTSLELVSNRIDDIDNDDEDINSSSPLGGTMEPYPTTAAAMDGTKKKKITMDEVWKWITASPEEALGINKKCVVQFGIWGKISMLSTMGDSDDYQNAIMEGCRIIAASDPTVRDANGRTNSGLYKFFISAIHSKELPAYMTTKYGKVNREMAEEYIWNDIKKHPVGSKNYIFELRRMPLEENHALLTANGTKYFDSIRIMARLQELRAMPADRKPYVKGTFTEDSSGRVIFTQDPEGHWCVSLHPYFSVEKKIDTRNRAIKDPNGFWRPPVNPEFSAGYDPVRYSDTTSTSISRASIMITKKFDYFGTGLVNKRAAWWIRRPEKASDGHYQFFLALKYFGCFGMHERQVETVVDEFEEYKALGMLSKSEKDGKYGMWTDNQRKVVKNGVDMKAAKWAIPKEEGQQDVLMEEPCEEVLVDADNFDIAKTTPYDAFMSDIMNEYNEKQMVFTNEVETSNKNINQLINELNAPRNN